MSEERAKRRGAGEPRARANIRSGSSSLSKQEGIKTEPRKERDYNIIHNGVLESVQTFPFLGLEGEREVLGFDFIHSFSQSVSSG